MDVHLNIVPFIDLPSRLIAFLLVAAAWSQVGTIDLQSRGLSSVEGGIDEPPALSATPRP